MRGDRALALRLLRRGSGLAGLLAAAGGALAVVAAARPAYVARAELSMLGEEQARTVAAVAGWEIGAGGLLGVLLGAAALALGVRLAIDRPPAPTRTLLLSVGGSLALIGAVRWAWRPSLDRLRDASGHLSELAGLADRLPDDVSLALSVGVGDAPALLVVAGAMVLVGALSADELRPPRESRAPRRADG